MSTAEAYSGYHAQPVRSRTTTPGPAALGRTTKDRGKPAEENEKKQQQKQVDRDRPPKSRGGFVPDVEDLSPLREHQLEWFKKFQQRSEEAN